MPMYRDSEGKGYYAKKAVSPEHECLGPTKDEKPSTAISSTTGRVSQSVKPKVEGDLDGDGVGHTKEDKSIAGRILRKRKK